MLWVTHCECSVALMKSPNQVSICQKKKMYRIENKEGGKISKNGQNEVTKTLFGEFCLSPLCCFHFCVTWFIGSLVEVLKYNV